MHPTRSRRGCCIILEVVVGEVIISLKVRGEKGEV
jgi:hypothetical protein